MAELMIAAGGIVENENGEILFIYRRGNWDLPKGKQDEGESTKICAVREVEEETGLRNIELGELVGVTHHIYTERGIEINKETFWFAMKVTGEQHLVPQTEEDIEKIVWVKETELKPYLSNTYDNIIEIVEKYYDKGNQVN